ncbi:MAG TPA: hypothetical protein VFF81_08220 [Noviherbaspirillum sp.]|nr:hypothetical protein [Noviherbaspirillum sp.]
MQNKAVMPFALKGVSSNERQSHHSAQSVPRAMRPTNLQRTELERRDRYGRFGGR